MVTFKNGTQIETIAVYGGTMMYQSTQRKTLELIIPADKLTLEEAKSIWQNTSATAEIVVEDNGETSAHLNYTLPVSLVLNNIDETNAIRIKLAQKSSLEIAQEKQAQDIDDVNVALCELADIIAGGEVDG